MKDCFGTIYPDLDTFRFGKEVNGKVFQMKIDIIGPGHRNKLMQADVQAWEECQRCEHFRSCYDFSSAKLAMQEVVAAI